MAAAVPGTPVTSANPNTTTNTSLTVTLASTTAGDVNIIRISGLASGTAINPTMTTPAGWVKTLEQMSASGTPSSFVAVYSRRYQAGDTSTVTLSWTNAGQMVATCTPFRYADPTSPIPYSTSAAKSGSNTTYTAAGTTGTDQGLLCYGAGNRTGTAWSALSDVDDGQVGLAASATMVSRITAAEVAGGTVFSKAMTGSNTSIGVVWAYTVKGVNRGTASGGFAFGHASTGAAAHAGTASGGFRFAGSAAGAATRAGVAAGTFQFAHTSTGSASHAGHAAGAVTFTHGSVGQAARGGSASGGFTVTAGAAGSTSRGGHGTGGVTLHGVVVGTTTRNGHAAGNTAWVGAAAGATISAGHATGTHAWAAAAAGRAIGLRDVTTTTGPTVTLHATGPATAFTTTTGPTLAATRTGPTSE